MKTPTKAAVVAVAVGALALAGVAPAGAATLPDDDELYVYSYWSGLFSSTGGGALTHIGGAPAGSVGAWGIDYDPVTGLAYFFDDDSTPCDLYSLDITTGIETLVGTISDGVNLYQDCDGIDITDAGDIWLAVNDWDLVRVSAADATVLEVVVVTGMDDSDEISFIATDPTSGIVYVGDYDTRIYTVDMATGAATFVASTSYIESGDFDSAGTLWYLGWGAGCENGLYSLDPADVPGTAVAEGDLLDGEDCVEAWALFVGPPTDDGGDGDGSGGTDPGLADSGSSGAWLWTALAAGLLVVGATLMRLVRRSAVTSG